MKKIIITTYLLLAGAVLPETGFAMHIAEGYLPQQYCYFWFALATPFVLIGAWKIEKVIKENPERKMLLGLAAAFIFVLSALKLPSGSGSTSHATGVGLYYSGPLSLRF